MSETYGEGHAVKFDIYIQISGFKTQEVDLIKKNSLK